MIAGVLALGCSLPLLWWLRRRAPGLPVLLARVLAVAVLAVGVGLLALYGWARTATDSSQLARAIVWGESEFGDQFRFPSRPMAASDEPLSFPVSDAVAFDRYRNAERGTALGETLQSTGTTAFVVLHRGRLVYEGYFNGSSRDSLQTSFSVAKSFTATLVGAAVEDGVLGGLDDPVTRYLPELADRDRRFDEIELRHLLTMTSGLSFRDGSAPWDDPANTYHGTDLRTAAVTEPVIEGPPGELFHYNDWNVILLGMVLERATGSTVAEFAEGRLWQPMGAEGDGSWSLDRADDGLEKMFVGLNGQAIDFAKLGWLYLNHGRVGNEQVVSSDFVAEATSRDTSTDPAANYQYLWWIDEDNPGAYYANGDHGQFIYVDPDAEVVITRNGDGPGGLDWVRFLGELAQWIDTQPTGP